LLELHADTQTLAHAIKRDEFLVTAEVDKINPLTLGTDFKLLKKLIHKEEFN
jgi:hypothetical protein